MKKAVGIAASSCLALAAMLTGCNRQYINPAEYSYGTPVVTSSAVQCPVVAVMPFQCMTDCPDAGMVVATTMASQINSSSGCVAISPEIVIAKAGAEEGEILDPAETGRKVGAPYILTGRVTQYSQDAELDEQLAVGVTARLIETATGREIWSGDGARIEEALDSEGDIDILTASLCGDLATSMRGNIVDDDTAAKSVAVVPAAPVRRPVRGESTKIMGPKVDTETVVPAVAAKPEQKAMGEGTADWVVSIEELHADMMDKDLKELAAKEQAKDAEKPDTSFTVESEGFVTESDIVGGLKNIVADSEDDDAEADSFGEFSNAVLDESSLEQKPEANSPDTDNADIDTFESMTTAFEFSPTLEVEGLPPVPPAGKADVPAPEIEALDEEDEDFWVASIRFDAKEEEVENTPSRLVLEPDMGKDAPADPFESMDIPDLGSFPDDDLDFFGKLSESLDNASGS